MPRIDPLQLLNCLQVLLSPSGGILSKDEVHRLASLMTKFSKKLVSKCVYVLILKNTEHTLLGAFMAAGGWTLIQLWLHDAMYSMNWALVKELLELLLITPVDVERLKSNNIPKLVKSLSKREDLEGIHELSNQLVQQWLKIVKDETQSEQLLATQQKQVQAVVTMTLPGQQLLEVPMLEGEAEDANLVAEVQNECGISPQTFYKLTLKDGKQIISKVEPGDTNYEVLENVEVVEMRSEDEAKEKEKEKERKDEKKKKSHDRSRHKSSSSSKGTSSRDKDKSSSHKDKDKHGSSSSSNSSSSSKDKDRHRDKDKRDKERDKDRHRSNGSVKSSSKSKSSSSKDKEKDKKESKEKQAEKDKDTLAKLQPQSVQKLPKIPKKSADDPEKTDKSKDAKEPKKEEPKKGTMSVEVRKNNEERPKTVKVYKSKMRSTGLEEEAKPAPPRPTKKPGPPVPLPPPPLPLKRPSPIRDISAVPPEKKTKIDAPLDRPGAIKLIPPKPKPPVLQESDMFMDALAASASTKKEPKKRKRRASVSKDSAGSPPSSPSLSSTNPASSPIGLKNIAPPKFYQDTLETDETKENAENGEGAENSDGKGNTDNRDDQMRSTTPTESMEEVEEESVTKNTGGLKGVLVYVRRKGPKKSIKWKPDEELVDVQYFELDETERVNVTKTFGDMAKMDVRGEREALQLSRKTQNEDIMDVQTLWRIPMEIDLPELLAEPGHKSFEKDIQFAREKSVLQALYFNKKMLPDNPIEPDPENYQIKDPVTIPIDDAENPDHDFRNTPWPEPKGSPPPPNIPNNVPPMFPNVQGPFQTFGVTPPPGFQNMQNVQQFPGPPFMPQNMMGGGEWNNVNMPNMHNPQMMPRNMGPPEMMNQGPMNPNMFIPPPENFNPMMNENNHRFPPPFNQQGPGPGPGPGPGMFPPNNFNTNRGGFRRGGGSGPWLRMNGPSPGGWNNNMRGGGGPHRGGRMCHHYRNKGFCKNRDNCPFFHPNN